MNLGYVILYVPNVSATVIFYEQAFGLKCRFVHEAGQYAEMETGATALAFAAEDLAAISVGTFTPHRLMTPPSATEIGLIADDVERAYTHAVNSGAIPVLAPTLKPWGQTVSYVRDNNGHLVEICSKVSGP
jgi:lactoylglutathione lyase